MDIRRLEEHVKNHPTDYQSVISLLKARSKVYEREQREARNAELKRVAKYRREWDEKRKLLGWDG